MIIKTFVVGLISTNCYLVYNEGGDKAFLVDPGRGYEKIKAYCDQNGLTVTGVLITHGHFDHILEASLWQANGAKLYIHEGDADKLYSDKNLAYLMSAKVSPCKADYLLKDGDTPEVAGFKLKVIHTPGHSEGSVSYVLDGVIFSGDTLFKGDFGRTDFPDGSFAKLKDSIINKLFSLSGDYRVLPGHDEETTLDAERKNNLIQNYK